LNNQYFIIVLAHSLHGKIRRFHINHKVIYAVIALALFGSFTLLGALTSYMRMVWKVANYNSLRQEKEFLRTRYQKLLNEANNATDQLAKLQLFASEVSVAYGIRKQGDGQVRPVDPSSMRLIPTMSETFDQYNMLRNASLSGHGRGWSRRWLTNTKPSLWPVVGRLLSHYGQRSDPFSGHTAFHAGVDISAATGTPARCTADGVVVEAEWMGAYGRLVVVDHGNGLSTYYAHLSRIDVIPGQEVRMAQIVGATGASGRVTSPHLHYEVRMSGNPVNPYPYLSRSALTPATYARDFGF